MTSRATNPLANVTMRASPSRRQSVTKPGARRRCTLAMSRNAAQTWPALAAIENSLRIEAMPECSAKAADWAWRILLSSGPDPELVGGLYAGGGQDLVPARDLGADVLVELLRAGADRDRARIGEALDDGLVLERLLRLGVDAIDDGARRLGRGDQRVPAAHREVGEAAFGGGRHVGQRGGALVGRGGERLEPPGLGVRRDDGDHRPHIRHVPGNHVRRSRAAALVWDVLHLGADALQPERRGSRRCRGPSRTKACRSAPSPTR